MKVPAIRKLPSGNYFCRIRVDGKTVCITDASKDAVYAKALAYKNRLLDIKQHPDHITLREAMDEYIDARRGARAASTIEGYEKIRNQHFLALQEIRLDKITKRDVDKAVRHECNRKAQYGGGKLSPKTIKNAVCFLRSVLHQYKIDAADEAIIPEVKRKVIKIHRAEEITKAVIGTDIELPCLLAMWLSLSMSEIRGLTKTKSLHEGMLYVEETVVRVKGEDVRKEGGKEEERSRAFVLPDYLRSLIDAVEGDIIVPLTPSQIDKRFKRLMIDAGMPDMNFHKLRHISASMCASLMIPDKITQERGGWKTDYVMKRVYTHTFVGEREIADRLMDERFLQIISEAKAQQNGNEI